MTSSRTLTRASRRTHRLTPLLTLTLMLTLSTRGGPRPHRPTPQPSDASSHEVAGYGSHADAGPDTAPSAGGQRGAERRISSFDEVVDGGYGIGSARPFDDGAQPLGHAVQAWTDRKSFSAPGDKGYDAEEPDVWFYNEDAARRAGFSRDGE